jgi:hypothetical protein
VNFRGKRFGFFTRVARKSDPVWWTTDATGNRVNTWIGIQSGEVPKGTTVGGKYIGFAVGRLYIVFCMFGKE